MEGTKQVTIPTPRQAEDDVVRFIRRYGVGALSGTRVYPPAVPNTAALTWTSVQS